MHCEFIVNEKGRVAVSVAVLSFRKAAAEDTQDKERIFGFLNSILRVLLCPL
jgi:hypothetical protein